MTCLYSRSDLRKILKKWEFTSICECEDNYNCHDDNACHIVCNFPGCRCKVGRHELGV